MTHREREEVFFHLGREGLPLNYARRIVHLANTLATLAVRQCNEPWTDALERRRDRARTAIDALLPKGWKGVYSGDPRGCVVKLFVPSGATNDWGREGICVA